MIFYDEKGKIPVVLLSGSSGTGKNWTVDRLSSKRFKQVKTYTTRQKRNESDYYHFVTEEEMDILYPKFCQKFTSGKVRYGCGEEDITEIVKCGKIPILIASPSAAMDMFYGLGEAVNKYSFFYVHINSHPDEAFYNLSRRATNTPDEVVQRIYEMDVVISSSFEKFLEDDSYNFISNGNNEFEIVSNSLEALEVIIQKYYLGIEEEI